MESIDQLYQKFLRHRNICTDSRKVVPGCLFFALKGEKFDGNLYAEEAIEKGAAFSIVSDGNLVGSQILQVDDTLICLQELAKFHRQKFEIPVFAITGSNGKTTTKELLQTVLQGTFQVHATPGNFNNHIGVPLTLLSMPDKTEFAIIEMGANHPGEIASLCEIAEPTAGTITSIGKAHLEGFGSLEGVVKAKSELLVFLQQNNGKIFLNKHIEQLKDWQNFQGGLVTFGIQGLSPELFFQNSILPIDSDKESLSFSFRESDGIQEFEVRTKLFGSYNFQNLACTVCVAQEYGVKGLEIRQRLESFVARGNRSQVVKRGGLTFVLDAYNANPTSMTMAIQSFAEHYDNRILILGDMKELGPDSRNEHEKIVKFLQKWKWEQIILIGKEFEYFKQESGATHFPEVQQARDWFYRQGYISKSCLLKGSRSMRLEEMLSEFTE